MSHQLCRQMCLDVNGTAGPLSEVSRAIAVQGNHNTCKLEMVVFAIDGTDQGVSAQLQVSNDGTTWSDQGTPAAMTTVGRKLLTTITDVTTSHVRYQFTMVGNPALAVFSATLSLSSQ